jgi:hypothetical protein
MSKNPLEVLRLSQTPSFTTESKTYIQREFGTVRNKCIGFIALLTKQGVTREIPLNEAIDLFQLHISNAMDRTTIKAYFGSMPGKAKKVIHREAQYASGTISNKTITLTEDIKKKEGYLEKLGLVHYEKRANTWFLVLNYENPIVPEMGKSATNTYESSSVSIDNFSLTLKHNPISQGEEFEKPICEGVSTYRETDKKNNNIIVRERNGSSESNPKTVTPKLTALEEAILRATILEGDKP